LAAMRGYQAEDLQVGSALVFATLVWGQGRGSCAQGSPQYCRRNRPIPGADAQAIRDDRRDAALATGPRTGRQRPCSARHLAPVAHGLRSKELLKAKWEDIDWDMGTLFVGLTKNGEPLLAPISDATMDRLNVIPRISDNPYIICGARSVPGWLKTGSRYTGSAAPPLKFVNRKTGAAVGWSFIDQKTGDRLNVRDVTIKEGPGADDLVRWRLSHLERRSQKA
jgi:integrase